MLLEKLPLSLGKSFPSRLWSVSSAKHHSTPCKKKETLIFPLSEGSKVFVFVKVKWETGRIISLKTKASDLILSSKRNWLDQD